MNATMNKYVGIVIVLLIGSTFFLGCDRTEDLLVRKDGTWNIISLNERTFRDSELLTDVDSTDNLGSVIFNADGSGRNLDATGGQIGDPFSWTYNDFALTITQGGESLVTTVLESTKKAQRWVKITEEDLLGYTYRTEVTTLLELAN